MTDYEALEFMKFLAQGGTNIREESNEACRIALDALQGRAERSKNEPLTLEELRQMEGKPVFLLTGEVSIMEQLIGEWDILNYWEGDWFDFTRRKRMLSEKDYGLTWLTYRLPPTAERSRP